MRQRAKYPDKQLGSQLHPLSEAFSGVDVLRNEFGPKAEAMTSAQPGQEQRMEIERKIDVRMSLEALLADEATIDETEADILSLFTRPTADLGEDGELVDGLREDAKVYDSMLHRAHAARCQAAADRLILYREARERDESLLRQAFEAIESGRSEPLFIMRDAIRNHLEDRAVLSRSGG